MTQSIELETGVEGLDTLLRGGIQLPEGMKSLIILVRGKPGSGKTTLALQIAKGADGWDALNPITEITYDNCQGDDDDLREKQKKLDIKENRISQMLKADDRQTNQYGDSILGEITEITKKLRNPGESEVKKRLVIVDGLNLLSSTAREIADLEFLVAALREHAKIGILIYEPSEGAYAPMDFQSDMVIELRAREIQTPSLSYYLQEICITKSRFQRAALGWHQYKIRDNKPDSEQEGDEKPSGDKKENRNGLHIFPSVHFRIHRHESTEDQQKGSHTPIGLGAKGDADKVEYLEAENDQHRSKISDMVNIVAKEAKMKDIPGLRKGSCTALLGPRGTLKTSLSFDFLRSLPQADSESAKERTLLLSLIDHKETIISERATLCDRYCRKNKRPHNCEYLNCYKVMCLLHFRPGCITTSEFFDILEEWLQDEEKEPEKREVQRLAFWDLAQLEYRYPLLASDVMFLPGLMDYLKHSHSMDDKNKPKRQITSVFMGGANGATAEAAAAIADNVFFFWRDQLKGKQCVAIYADRIQGCPGVSKLFYIPQRDTGIDIREGTPDGSGFDRAPAQIEAIRRLQGLASIA